MVAVSARAPTPDGEFLGVEVRVGFARKPGAPQTIVWGARTIPITRVVSTWVETGSGTLARHARRWWLRRRRTYYVVETPQGVFELYHDRGERRRDRWVLVRRVEAAP